MTSIPAHQDKKRSAAPKERRRMRFIRNIWPFSYFRESRICREIQIDALNRSAAALNEHADLLAEYIERRDRAASANTTKK